MFHFSYLQAKQDQLEADGLFNPAFFGNQARGFLITTSDFITKFMACFCCMSVGQGSDPPDWIRIRIQLGQWIRIRNLESDLGNPKSVTKKKFFSPYSLDLFLRSKKKIFNTNVFSAVHFFVQKTCIDRSRFITTRIRIGIKHRLDPYPDLAKILNGDPGSVSPDPTYCCGFLVPKKRSLWFRKSERIVTWATSSSSDNRFSRTAESAPKVTLNHHFLESGGSSHYFLESGVPVTRRYGPHGSEKQRHLDLWVVTQSKKKELNLSRHYHWLIENGIYLPVLVLENDFMCNLFSRSIFYKGCDYFFQSCNCLWQD